MRRGFLILGVLFVTGLWLAWPSSRPFLILLFLSALLLGFLRKAAPPPDSPFLLKLFLAALTLRVGLAAAHHYGLGGTLNLPPLDPDAERYSAWGWYISTLLKGQRLQPLSPEAFSTTFPDTIPYVLYQDFMEIAGGDRFPPYWEYSVGWYPYFLGALYSWTGYFPILPRLLNTVVGSLLPILAFSLGQEAFGPKAARVAGLLSAFFPSLILWSTTGLQDPYLILMMLLAWLGLMRWVRTRKVRWAAAFGVGVVGMGMVKYLFGFLALLALGGWGLACLVQWAGKKMRFAFLTLFLIGVAALSLKPSIPREIYQKVSLTAVGIQFENYTGGGRTYAIYPFSSPQEHPSKPYPPGTFLLSLLRGYVYFFFAPFPGQGNSLKDLLLSLHMVLGYLFLLPGALGFLHALRSDWRANLPIALFLLLAASFMAATEANFGTLVRRRDFLMPLLLIYAAGGLGSLTSRPWGALARGPEAPRPQRG